MGHRTEAQTIGLDVPYVYGQDFTKAKATKEEDKKKVVENMEQELKKQLVAALYFFSETTKDVYKAEHGSSESNLMDKISKMEIESIDITGFSSPEAEVEGKSSIEIGQVEDKNLKLGKNRAEDMSGYLKEAMKKSGLNADSIKVHISSEEVQFTPEEMATMDSLATVNKIPGKDKLEKIFNMIVAYNHGALERNLNLKVEMGKILDKKRKVEIKIKFKEGKEKRIVLPLPLTLMLLPFLKNIKDLFSRDEYEDGIEDLDAREVFSEKVIDEKKIKISP